ncbi:ABC transporter ATP-binding protein [Bifidobacterium amazonense]|uniref:ABC transporter ATP-binding protein n=1 Tax=Bifidobacterium amazonense TaxID=2809027 RepID=A0ABS9VX01_9BIFI|nr:ABC transporter ATP-binding protein [Bifidobacterium amazonense]MCH9276642.1 ABC transporter ATP-binding protein [Bifidobacterium amazonense]
MTNESRTEHDNEKAESVNTAVKKEDNRPVVLKVEHVAKYFRLPTEQATGLKMAFLNWTRGIKGYTEQRVLRDINFEVRQGDFFGIVGRNGSGKSTLLKIISGIYTPEKGKVSVKGKLVPFIELGVGFNPELTGRENVYLNGALLGFSHDEIDAMYDDIVDFAELGEFMDQKLKNYSSGMQVRLAFSVAIKAQGDILVLDEVLAVGDEAFQRKCDNFFSEIRKDPTKTVILVTHSMDSVKKYCNNAILIKDGEIIVSGNKNDVADRYTLENLKRENKKPADDDKKKDEEPKYPTGLNETVPLLTVRPSKEPVCDMEHGFDFEVEYDYRGDKDFYVAFSLNDIRRGGVPFGDSFDLFRPGHQTVRFHVPMDIFTNGEFRIIASIHEYENGRKDPEHVHMVAFTNENLACDFSMRDPKGADNFALLNKMKFGYEIVDTDMASHQGPAVAA